MKILLLAAALAAATSAGPAFAEPSPARATVVSTAGLDLGSDAGVRALDRRILHAASALCGTPSAADPRGRIKYDECRDEARANVAAERNRLIAAAQAGEGVAIASSR